MVEKQHYRWDFVGLSTDTKPTPETSEKVVDGSTYYESDTSKLYVFCDTEWYERKPLGGGGGGSDINVVQTTGQSTTDVMSQKAVTDALAGASGEPVHELTEDDYNFDYGNTGSYNTVALWLLEPGLYTKSMGSTVRVANYNYGLLGEGYTFLVTAPMGTGTNAYRYIYGTGTGNTGKTSAWYVKVSNGSLSETYSGEFFTGNVVSSPGTSTTNVMSQNATTSMIYADPSTRNRVQLGSNANSAGNYASVLGTGGQAGGISSVALANSDANTQGQFDVSTIRAPGTGYNGTNLRRITGVYDPVLGTDVANKRYVDTALPPVK